ncbi:MAG: hypothetical protein ACE5KK_02750 [Candidatus Brocadiales bacterium]
MEIPRFWLFILVVSNIFFFLLGFFVGSRFSYAAEYLQGFRAALLVITAITLSVGAYKLYKRYVK